MTARLKELLSRFDKTYVLTIRRATNRHALMSEVLAGVDFEFFFGVDGKEYSTEALHRLGDVDEERVRRHDLSGGQVLYPGSIGCSLSHRLLYEKVAASSWRSVLILEDDVEFAQVEASAVAAGFAELPSDWELLYLDYKVPVEPSLVQRLIQVKHIAQSMAGRFPLSAGAILRRFSADYSPHLLRAGYLFYTSAYAITPAAAATLFRLQSPMNYAADHLLGKACTERLVNAFALKHKLFDQYSIRKDDRSTTG